jgi:reactive intermediate/imine deaminase
MARNVSPRGRKRPAVKAKAVAKRTEAAKKTPTGKQALRRAAAAAPARARQLIDPGWQWDRDFPLAQGVRIGDLLYVSGQISVDADGNLVGRGDLRAQTRQVFENMKSVLDKAGATFQDIIKMNTFFTADIHNYEDYFAVRRDYLKGNRPASTGVQVVALAFEGLMLEVEAIAHLARGRR